MGNKIKQLTVRSLSSDENDYYILSKDGNPTKMYFRDDEDALRTFEVSKQLVDRSLTLSVYRDGVIREDLGIYKTYDSLPEYAVNETDKLEIVKDLPVEKPTQQSSTNSSTQDLINLKILEALDKISNKLDEVSNDKKSSVRRRKTTK
jgi:hypothetical protein